MRTKTLLLSLLIVGTSLSYAQTTYDDDDDIYYNPKKAKKEAIEAKRKANYIPNRAEMDVDAYNRRGQYYATPVDTIGMAAMTDGDFKRTQDIQRFYNPTIIVDNIDELSDILSQSYGNVEIVISNDGLPWFIPSIAPYSFSWLPGSVYWASTALTSPWGWGWYDSFYPWGIGIPSYWNWGINPNYWFGWNGPWNWSFGWGWNPGYWGPAWGPGWGPCWGGGIASNRPAYRPNGNRPAGANPGWSQGTRPSGINSGRLPSGFHRPSYSTHGVGTSGTTTNKRGYINNNHRKSNTTTRTSTFRQSSNRSSFGSGNSSRGSFGGGGGGGRSYRGGGGGGHR